MAMCNRPGRTKLAVIALVSTSLPRVSARPAAMSTLKEALVPLNFTVGEAAALSAHTELREKALKVVQYVAKLLAMKLPAGDVAKRMAALAKALSSGRRLIKLPQLPPRPRQGRRPARLPTVLPPLLSAPRTRPEQSTRTPRPSCAARSWQPPARLPSRASTRLSTTSANQWGKTPTCPTL